MQDKKLEIDKREISDMKQYILKLTDDHMKIKKDKDAKILELEQKIKEMSEKTKPES